MNAIWHLIWCSRLTQPCRTKCSISLLEQNFCYSKLIFIRNACTHLSLLSFGIKEKENWKELTRMAEAEVKQEMAEREGSVGEEWTNEIFTSSGMSICSKAPKNGTISYFTNSWLLSRKYQSAPFPYLLLALHIHDNVKQSSLLTAFEFDEFINQDLLLSLHSSSTFAPPPYLQANSHGVLTPMAHTNERVLYSDANHVEVLQGLFYCYHYLHLFSWPSHWGWCWLNCE